MKNRLRVGLFPDHDFEFRFGARPGNAVAFFADTSENATLMEGRRSALEETPAQCLFEEPSAAEAVAECLAWVGLDGGGCRKLALHWEPDKAWQRSNWGLSRSSALNQHPTRNIPRLTPPFTDAEAWIRIEDQVLFRLPQTQAMLFGIRLVNVSLAELKQFPEAQAGLHRAIATMPDDVADYKNVTEAREHLLEMLG